MVAAELAQPRLVSECGDNTVKGLPLTPFI